MLIAPLTNNPARLFVEKAEMSSKKWRRRVGKGVGEGGGKGTPPFLPFSTLIPSFSTSSRGIAR